MSEYLVVWSIELDADSPRHAAELARVCMRDPDSIAGVFEVTEYAERSGGAPERKQAVQVDLDKLEGRV